MADGEIIVDVSLNDSKFQKGIENLISKSKDAIEDIDSELKKGINQLVSTAKVATETIGSYFDKINKINFSGIVNSISEINEGVKSINNTISQLPNDIPLRNANKEIKEISTNINTASNSASEFTRRIYGLMKSAFVFNILSKRFRDISNSIFSLIQRDNQLSKSLEIIRANIINAFIPILRITLPIIRAIGDAIVWLAQKFVGFINFITGSNMQIVSSGDDALKVIEDFDKLIGKTKDISEEINMPAIENIRDKVKPIKESLPKIKNILPKINKDLSKTNNILASFDKIEVLKNKKSFIDKFTKSTQRASNNLKDVILSPISGVRSGIKNVGSGIKKLGGSRNKIELPKISIEVDENVQNKIKEIRDWLKGSSTSALVFKSILAGIITYLGSVAVINTIKKFGELLAGMFVGAGVLNPWLLGLSALVGGISYVALKTKDILEEGIKFNEEYKKSHPEDYDERGNLIGLREGETLDQWAEIDTELAEIIAYEEKWKKLRKERKEEPPGNEQKNINNILELLDKQRTKSLTTFDLIKFKSKELFSKLKENVSSWLSDSWNSISSWVSRVFKDVKNNLVTGLNNYWNEITSWFNTLRDMISNWFGNLWSKSGEWVSNTFTNIKDSVVNGLNNCWNEITSWFRTLWGWISNWFGDLWGSIKRGVPEFLSNVFGWKSNPQMPMFDVPQLAQGAVLKGGDPFLAYVNDQPRGKTNIEAPLATIVDAFRDAIRSEGYGTQNITLSANGDISQIIRMLSLKITDEQNRIGNSIVSISYGGDF